MSNSHKGNFIEVGVVGYANTNLETLVQTHSLEVVKCCRNSFKLVMYTCFYSAGVMHFTGHTSKYLIEIPSLNK